MELMLWRWSTTLQVASAVMIAALFVGIARTARRREARPWGLAWMANLFALVITVVYWFVNPQARLAGYLFGFGYLLGKTAFVVLLVLGARAFALPGMPALPERRGAVAVGIAVFSALAAALFTGIDGVGALQSGIMAVGCTAGAAILLSARTAGSYGLALGFGLRAVLGAVESLAYLGRALGAGITQRDGVGLFLASHSSLDTGAEWVIALGCVLTLYRHIQLELMQTNRELSEAHNTLQGLVDRDPLTGLENRRALPGVLRLAWETGATLLFFDLDDFKAINDTLGHRAGDECLRRFARTLRAGFRPDDHVLRYAGDEFVVVARGAEPEAVLGHLAGIRESLARPDGSTPPIRFAVGHTYLAPGGDPERALEAADAAMYAAKTARAHRAGARTA